MNGLSEALPAGWAWFIAIGTGLSLAYCLWVLISNQTKRAKGEAASEPKLHGSNVWDGLREYDNPLPRWWRNLFYITVFFAIAYLILYPGLGVSNGILGWSSGGLYKAEVEATEKRVAPIFEGYAKQEVAALAADQGATKIGASLFQAYCIQCHGSDMRGAKGFPNLVDADWQWAGTPEGILETILGGRNAAMPAFGEQFNKDQIADVVNYVIQLSGRQADLASAARGEATYKTVCAGCHGPEGKGMQALGAPNLTDSTWLYGGSTAAITETLVKGRAGVMPAFKEFLGEPRVKLLAAYVYAESREAARTASAQ
ncbi:MAG: cytochrome-c oxidase, cbb3-type subunit III [Casimicrobiaceae bacterium]